ncbi:MAG: hypothetical protein Q8P91_03525 [bacterium]|nr:hypothetical protein [bacterium]
MKRKIVLLIILIILGFLAYTTQYIPVFYLKQNYESENINFSLYKNPWYYQKNIAVLTEPFMITQATEINKWKWNINIKGEVSLFPKVYVRVINADTENIITEKIVSIFSIVQPKQQKDLLVKINSNYPYRELFPYVSSTMIANYTNEPKTILITRKTSADVSLLMNELDMYLKKNLINLDVLKQNGVIINYSKEINRQAVEIVE